MDSWQQLSGVSNVMEGLQEAQEKSQEDQNGERVSPRKCTGGMASRWEMGDSQWGRADAGISSVIC
jgi:hypothetical protein